MSAILFMFNSESRAEGGIECQELAQIDAWGPFSSPSSNFRRKIGIR